MASATAPTVGAKASSTRVGTATGIAPRAVTVMAWLKYHGDGSNTSSPGSTIAMRAAKASLVGAGGDNNFTPGIPLHAEAFGAVPGEGRAQIGKPGVGRVAMDLRIGQGFDHTLDKRGRWRDVNRALVETDDVGALLSQLGGTPRQLDHRRHLGQKNISVESHGHP